MSSSSTSTEYNEECYQYYNKSYQSFAFPSIYKNPFFPTVVNPLVYLTEVPPRRKRQNKKNDPNCFVKAFRWYTQEHVPPKRDENCATDLPGFAHWLDNKYDEFVKSSQIDKGPYKLTIKQTSTFTADRIPTTLWKNRHSEQSYVGVKEKELQNVEYIMQPKGLVRPASECCHQTPCGVGSNTTPTSTDTRGKKTNKSRSLTSIQRDNREPIDLITIHEGAIRSGTLSPKYIQSSAIKKSDYIKKRPHKKNFYDRLCQCPEETIRNMDVGIQYDNPKIQITRFICEKCAACCSGVTPTSQTAQDQDIKSKNTNNSVSNVNASGNLSEVICECNDERPLTVDNNMNNPRNLHKYCNSAKSNAEKESPCKRNAVCQKTNVQNIKNKTVNHAPISNIKDVSGNLSDVICECIDKKSVTIAEAGMNNPQNSNACNCGKSNATKESPCQNNILCQKTNKTQITTNTSPLSMVKYENTTRIPDKCNRISNTIQTSDHSIHLEQEPGQDYPWLMKIIYTNKLNEKR